RYLAYAQEVIFGPGRLAQLPEAVGRFGWRRLMLVTSGSARRAGHVAAVEGSLGPAVVAVYDRVQPHVPEAQVAEALALAQQHNFDAVIGLGGGSPIGLAKALGHALAGAGSATAGASAPLQQPQVPVIAIPTTYAGSEMTAVFGVTRSQTDGSS